MIPEDDLLVAALEDNPSARQDFLQKHGKDAKGVARKLANFYNEFGRATAGWPHSARARTVAGFLHVAGNSLVQSLNLLVVGMGAPSGNLMRHYAEAVAMALLCAVPETGVLEQHLGGRDKYPIHKAIDRLLQKKAAGALGRRIGFDQQAWTEFRNSVAFFDNHSHSSVVALGYHLALGADPHRMVIGTAYDPAKAAFYRKELKARLHAATQLVAVLRVLSPVLQGHDER